MTTDIGVCPTLWKEETYNIGTQFNTGLTYGDVSGLNDDECKALEEFEQGLPPAGCWEFNGREEFVRDDVTGLMGDCFVSVYRYKQEWKHDS